MTIKTQYELTTFLVRNLKKTDLTANERFTLIMLSDRVNDKMECWPSYEILAEDTGFSLRSVKTYVKSLADKGVISVRLNRTKGATWQHNVYTFNISNIIALIGGTEKAEQVVVEKAVVKKTTPSKADPITTTKEVQTIIVNEPAPVQAVVELPPADELTVTQMMDEMESVGITVAPFSSMTDIKARYTQFQEQMNAPF